MSNFFQPNPPALRQTNKVATTNVTNEIAQYLRNQISVSGSPPPRYIAGSTVFICKVGSQKTDDNGKPIDGWFNGVTFNPQSNPDPQDSPTESDIGNIGKEVNVTILDIGSVSGGSSLNSGSYTSALWTGFDIQGNLLAVSIASSPSASDCTTLLHGGGADGTATTAATWKYDIYAISDTDQEHALNGDIPLSPEYSVPRLTFGGVGSVTPASDGSRASYYIDSSGFYHLFECQEKGPLPSICVSI